MERPNGFHVVVCYVFVLLFLEPDTVLRPKDSLLSPYYHI